MKKEWWWATGGDKLIRDWASSRRIFGACWGVVRWCESEWVVRGRRWEERVRAVVFREGFCAV